MKPAISTDVEENDITYDVNTKRPPSAQVVDITFFWRAGHEASVAKGIPASKGDPTLEGWTFVEIGQFPFLRMLSVRWTHG